MIHHADFSFDNLMSVVHRSAVKDTEEWPSKYSKLFVEVRILFFPMVGMFMLVSLSLTV